jgi:ABC-2 type transport system ATP-binding protein
MTASSAIHTSQLTKTYGVNGKTVALQPTTLTVPAGAVFALVGHNGAGKTTLIKLLMNILEPTSGTSTVLGQPSSSLTGAAFERIGYVSENQDLPTWMTVKQFLDYLAPFYPNWDLGDLVTRLDLPLDRKLKHLSRGMLMKAALASVLAFSPQLIVMDEPFSGLDPLVRDELIEALAAHTRATNATVLISSHDLAEIEAFATHIGFIHQGTFLFNEELSTLSARFREVTVTFAPKIDFSSRPESAPFADGVERPASSGAPGSDSGTRELPALITPPTIVFPTNHPPSWLLIENLGSAVRFTHTQADTENIQAEVAAAFPTATAVQVLPMNLRSIFLALAKSGKVPATPSEARTGGTK